MSSKECITLAIIIILVILVVLVVVLAVAYKYDILGYLRGMKSLQDKNAEHCKGRKYYLGNNIIKVQFKYNKQGKVCIAHMCGFGPDGQVTSNTLVAKSLFVNDKGKRCKISLNTIGEQFSLSEGSDIKLYGTINMNKAIVWTTSVENQPKASGYSGMVIGDYTLLREGNTWYKNKKDSTVVVESFTKDPKPPKVCPYKIIA